MSCGRPRGVEVEVEGGAWIATVDLGGLSAMMVLLLKQMHLQKEVAEAVGEGVSWCGQDQGNSGGIAHWLRMLW